MNKTTIQFVQAENIEQAAQEMPWAFKVIKFEDGYLGFDSPLTAHLFKVRRQITD